MYVCVNRARGREKANLGDIEQGQSEMVNIALVRQTETETAAHVEKSEREHAQRDNNRLV